MHWDVPNSLLWPGDAMLIFRRQATPQNENHGVVNKFLADSWQRPSQAPIPNLWNDADVSPTVGVSYEDPLDHDYWAVYRIAGHLA